MSADFNWDPLALLENPKGKCYGVLKLNSPFYDDYDLKLFTEAWENASMRCAADGGSNVLFNNVPCSHQGPTLPDFISGDFDSIKENVMSFYKENGVEIIPTPDQNETDFTKCLRILLQKAAKQKLKMDGVIVHVGIPSRRLDHTLSNINTLIHHASQHTSNKNQENNLSPNKNIHQPAYPHISPTYSIPINNLSNTLHITSPTTHQFSISPLVKHYSSSPYEYCIPASPSTHHPSFDFLKPVFHPFVFLIYGDSISFILPIGTHRIECSSKLRGKWCSLVPIIAPTLTTTKGLTYNLDNQVMSFGGLISTSNSFSSSSDYVWVENDQPLLWSMGIKF